VSERKRKLKFYGGPLDGLFVIRQPTTFFVAHWAAILWILPDRLLVDRKRSIESSGEAGRATDYSTRSTLYNLSEAFDKVAYARHMCFVHGSVRMGHVPELNGR
jgi:hypothetical protein